jgi:putative ABC transport system permease protein
MNWIGNLRTSVRALNRARTRTLLSSSSMAIGISSMVMLFGVGAGTEAAFEQALEAMGKNLLAIGAQRRSADALRGGGRRYQSLTMDDYRAISTELDGVLLAAPIAMMSASLRYRGEQERFTVIGTTPEFQYTNNQNPVAGRFIDAIDIADRARVAVIGAEVARKLFFDEQPLGERLLVEGAPYTVIGVLQEKGVDQTGSSQDDRVLVPVTTAMRRLLGADYVDRIFVQVTSRGLIGATMAALEQLLRGRHDLDLPGPGQTRRKNDFTITDQASLLNTLNETDRRLSRLLGGIAALTLGLASLGLLAVSLLSVRERQGEIGLRLAVGALPGQILLQFLAEAMIIALLGALTGVLFGALGIVLGERLFGWRMLLTWSSVGYTFLVALALSLLFGAYPALRAARQDPIVALRIG